MSFFLVERPLQLNKKARKSLKGEGLDRLAELRDVVGDLKEWTPDTIAAAISDFRERHNLSMGQIGSAVTRGAYCKFTSA